MPTYLVVGVFGLLGVYARWFIDGAAKTWFHAFPMGILGINVLGSLLAGALYVVGTEKNLLPPYLAIGLLVGFCGGFTTFSTYSLEAFLYLDKSDLVRGLGYLALSPVLGLLGAYLGVTFSRACL